MTGSLIGKMVTDDGRPFLEKVYLADRWWSRFRGLQFLPEIPLESGLLLKPCRSVHTCWMRFPIHVIFLDRDGRVVDCRASVPPWRTAVSRCSNIAATLEVSALKELPATGERLIVVPSSADPPIIAPPAENGPA